MHRVIQDHLEEVLAEPNAEGPTSNRWTESPAARHLAQCGECREEVSLMRQHAGMMSALRAADESPRPGFYARVMERIEAQRPIDIWQLFFDSAFGRRLATASMGLAVLFGLYLVSSERLAPMDGPARVSLSNAGMPDKDAVLVDLVTYREP
jgi:hypothetical protein